MGIANYEEIVVCDIEKGKKWEIFNWRETLKLLKNLFFLVHETLKKFVKFDLVASLEIYNFPHAVDLAVHPYLTVHNWQNCYRIFHATAMKLIG